MPSDTESELESFESIRRESTQYYDEDGDVEILSSDRVMFKLHRYHLQTTSNVFRDMMNMADDKDGEPLELDDQDIESHLVLEAALDLVISQKSFYDIPEPIASRVVLFLRKYDFAQTLELCKLHLIRGLFEGKSPFAAFVRATYLEDHGLCGRAIMMGATWTWSGTHPEKEVFGRDLKQAMVFDMRAIARDRMAVLPLDCTWALLRASTKLGAYEVGAKMDAKAMGEEYVRLMRLRDGGKAS